MPDADADRDAAIMRLKNKRDFRMHLGAFVIINGMFVALWALTGTTGHFWPMWIILFWGIGLAFHGWWAFFSRPFTEDDIQREMHGR